MLLASVERVLPLRQLTVVKKIATQASNVACYLAPAVAAFVVLGDACRIARGLLAHSSFECLAGPFAWCMLLACSTNAYRSAQLRAIET
jgi:hypothetical protein